MGNKMKYQRLQIVALPYYQDWGQVEQEVEDRVVHPLVQHYWGVVAVATDIVDGVPGYEKTDSLDKGFSIPQTKGIAGLDVVSIKSKGSNIAVHVAKVGATVYQDMSIAKEIYY